LAGAAIGHGLAWVAVSTVEGGENTSETEGVGVEDVDVGVEGVPVSEPHAASVMASEAAHATSATENETRDEFTVRHATAHLAAFADTGPLDRERRNTPTLLIAVEQLNMRSAASDFE
jgi:hypothetical protein